MEENLHPVHFIQSNSPAVMVHLPPEEEEYSKYSTQGKMKSTGETLEQITFINNIPGKYKEMIILKESIGELPEKPISVSDEYAVFMLDDVDLYTPDQLDKIFQNVSSQLESSRIPYETREQLFILTPIDNKDKVRKLLS